MPRERAQDERPRRLEAAHELDDDVHVGIVEHARGVVRERERGEIEPLARACQIGVGDGRQRQPAARPLLERGALRLEDLHHAGPDGAEAQKSDTYLADGAHRMTARGRLSGADA